VKCDTVKIYKKNKLVFGFENRKYVKHLFNSVFNNNSSLSRGSGIQAGGLSSNVKSYSNQSFIPIICYEVMFGDYLSKFLNKNSRIIVQISEDGWSSYKVSKRQCLQFSRLRAIEVRKDLVRSSNCGHTAYINSLGDIEASLLGSKSGVLCRNLTSNKYTTFYSKNSDFIGIVFVFFTILILINLFVNKKY
jgi:apolipoprotein N-acyltransferase